jgi:hypothetical protein
MNTYLVAVPQELADREEGACESSLTTTGSVMDRGWITIEADPELQRPIVAEPFALSPAQTGGVCNEGDLNALGASVCHQTRKGGVQKRLAACESKTAMSYPMQSVNAIAP